MTLSNVSDDQLMTESFFKSTGLASDFGARARLGVYVHVPFCPHICPYCDFVKTAKFSRADVRSYFAALVHQFDRLMHEIPLEIQTISLYFGGGTPSLFPAEFYQPLVAKLRSRFVIEEFTLETNPYSNVERVFSEWVGLGANRITLGAQSLEPGILHYLGRKHSAKDVLKNIESARFAGIEQVQVDLIFGIKESLSTRSLSSEIRSLEGCGATGVSSYLLTIEESTPFALESNSDDEQVVREYNEIQTTCAEVGFVQQETSNFSRFVPVHNRLYWYGLPYMGIGTGAHGLLPATSRDPLGRRYRVGPLNLNRRAGDDHLPFASESELLFELQFSGEERNREAYLQEMLLTLLRTQAGIPLKWLDLVYPKNDLTRLWNDPRVYRGLDTGLLERTESHLRLSDTEKLRGDSWALVFYNLLH